MFQPSPLISLVATAFIIQGVYLLKISFIAPLGSLLPYWTSKVQASISGYGGYNPLKLTILNRIIKVPGTATYPETDLKPLL